MSLVKQLLLSRAVNLGARFPQKVSYSVHKVAQNATAAHEIGETLWAKLAGSGITYLLAPGSGAAPVAAAIGAAALRRGVVLETLHVRDPERARKDEELVEGQLPAAPVKAAFVDDILMLGGTYRRTLETVTRYTPYIECVAVALVLDPYFPKGTRALAARGLPVHSVVDRQALGLSRDAAGSMGRPFAPAKWMRAGLVTRPQYQRKTVPIVTSEEVIVGLDDCSVASYAIEDGALRWRIRSPVARGKGSSCELLLAPDGTLYSGNYAGILTASRKGEVLWRYAYCLAIHSRPTLAAGRLYQNVEDRHGLEPRGRLLCVDAATGRLLWEVQHPNYGPTGVEVVGNLAITAHNSLEVIAVSLEGEIRWRHAMKAHSRARVLVHEHAVIYLDELGWLVKLEAATGREMARRRFSTSSNHAEPLLVDGVIVVTDNAWHMAGYDARTLERIWVNRLRGPCQWKPAVSRGLLLTQTTTGGLAATVAATGEKKWESAANGRWGTGPIGLSDAHAAILSMDGRLTLHELESMQ
jgi:outer membrane protein assembly factor BamB/orotate phosphoribosyltransferase